MKSLLVLLFITMSSSLFAGAMSDIDLETREAISNYFEYVDYDAIHSLRFSENSDGCYFTIQASVYDKTCFVCFQGEGRNFYSTEVSCQ